MVALALAGVSIFKLEQGRAGLVASQISIGTTPATIWRLPGEQPGPVVVIAHGFAGSQQLMLGFSQTLARAGYIAVAYDLEGHGRNAVPMSGDVSSTEGTTRLLIEELDRVIDASLALPGAEGVALLGHSMATDIIVRQAVVDPRVQATVAVSMFSGAVTADAPGNLLIINGAWEDRLVTEAARVIALTDRDAQFGQTLGDPALGTGRRAVNAPNVEHVGVLYASTTLREARDWLDAVFDRQSDTPIKERGGWIVLLIVSVTALAWPLARLARPLRASAPPMRLPGRKFWMATLGPMIITPLVLWPIEIGFLPVLVADYLAVHFALYGLLSLAVLWRADALHWERVGLILSLPIALFCILIFGGMLDRYVTSFLAFEARIGIIAAIALGAIPFMLADGYLTEGGCAPLWRVMVVRTCALASLGIATALDLEGLFFLLLIMPIILLFFLLFGTLAGWVGRATHRPVAAGLGLGVFLGWALGVTFPLFAI
ncbi:alpha/beta hydrolase [Cognatiyoonia sp. IB215182]|uniref:alpha/beta hydrolase n=1 Tax=Cognatiyoonia sp. IB215182 TaxID=3097353 RepID=UPI002A0FA63C|nr:alpha/beta fold hydrolase [Cognatiyoonia sp. IB215182]MDX8352654.1 alpha/beta fold hydrolase [Cognatiyoonia sp. IB215182]